MINIIAVTTILCTLFTFATADSTELFNQANKFFEERQYEESGDLLQKIIDDGTVNGQVMYNLGNVNYRLGRIGMARLHYERALRLIPNDQDVINNINYIERRFLKQTLREDNFSSLDAVLRRTLSFIPKDLSIMIGVIAYILLNLLYTLNLIKPGSIIPAIRWGIAIILVLVVTISFTVAIALEVLTNDNSYGVVVAQDAGAASEPSRLAPSRFPVPEAMKVKITRSQGDWFEVVLPNGSKGWVPDSTIEII